MTFLKGVVLPQTKVSEMCWINKVCNVHQMHISKINYLAIFEVTKWLIVVSHMGKHTDNLVCFGLRTLMPNWDAKCWCQATEYGFLLSKVLSQLSYTCDIAAEDNRYFSLVYLCAKYKRFSSYITLSFAGQGFWFELQITSIFSSAYCGPLSGVKLILFSDNSYSARKTQISARTTGHWRNWKVVESMPLNS